MLKRKIAYSMVNALLVLHKMYFGNLMDRVTNSAGVGGAGKELGKSPRGMS